AYGRSTAGEAPRTPYASRYPRRQIHFALFSDFLTCVLNGLNVEITHTTMKSRYFHLPKALAACIAFAGLAATASTNRVLMLNGKTSYLEVPDSPALHSISNGLTLELWFTAKSFSPSSGDVVSLIRKNIEVEKENFFLRFRTRGSQTMVEFCPGIQIGTFRA